MSVPVRDFLKRRRDRLIGSILGYAERELFEGLTKEQREGLRKVVIDATNGYHDSVLDLVKAEDGIRNDEVVALLERVDLYMRRGAGMGSGRF